MRQADIITTLAHILGSQLPHAQMFQEAVLIDDQQLNIRANEFSGVEFMPGKLLLDKPETSDEIWYLTFESLQDFGSGLASYCREVSAAAKSCQRRVRFFELSRSAPKSYRHVDARITRVFISDAIKENYSALGYWANVSYAFAEAVLQEIRIYGPPRMIEIPDGFGIGYFLLQRKKTGEPLLQDIPIILTAHTPVKVINEWNGQETNTLPDWWTYRMEKWCYLAADGIVVLSNMLKDTLSKQGYLNSGQKLFALPNPCTTLLGQERRKNVPAGYTIGMASRMVNWKGLREALDIIRAAMKANIDLNLELCGHSHSDFNAAQKDYADVFVSGRVRYLGVLTSEQLIARRKTWISQIHPSTRDNFPYSVLEALLQGVPCLISAENGVAEAIPADLAANIVVDFKQPETVFRALKLIDETTEKLNTADFTSFSTEVYFEHRDAMTEQLRGITAGVAFPFIDSSQARFGLRPQTAIAPSGSGARLTVVIPYYNMAHYIDACVHSALTSTVTVDLIIVNDGSPDLKSIEKLDDFRNHPQITVLDTQNGGVARARNYGVSHAKTEFVALLDADDTVEPNYYKLAIDVLDRYDNVGFVGCWCNDFSDETGKTIRYWPTYNAEPMPNIVMNNTNCQALIYRRDLYEKSGQHDPSLKMYLDDWDGMLGMLEGGYFGVMLPDAHFNYRQRSGSIFSTGRSLWDVNYSAIVNKRRALYERNGPEALLFTNSNGPNKTYHLLGWQTPLQQTSIATRTTGTPRRLKMPHRIARSIAKRLMRFADKGYRK